MSSEHAQERMKRARRNAKIILGIRIFILLILLVFILIKLYSPPTFMITGSREVSCRALLPEVKGIVGADGISPEQSDAISDDDPRFRDADERGVLIQCLEIRQARMIEIALAGMVGLFVIAIDVRRRMVSSAIVQANPKDEK